VDDQGNATNYALCQIQVGLTGSCSTHYNATVSGASMEAVCEDDSDPMQYNRLNEVSYTVDTQVPFTGNETLSIDVATILGDWARSQLYPTNIQVNNC
jgi:hypothetical protein